MLTNNEDKELLEETRLDIKALATMLVMAREMTVITTASKEINNARLREGHNW
ncbi:hypothetical protein LguiB_019455 [Lonicera macranthoides]